MKIIPLVLLLRCVEFLPHHCNAEPDGEVALTTSCGDLYARMVSVNEDPDWIQKKPKHNFDTYEVYARTFENTCHYRSQVVYGARETAIYEAPTNMRLMLHNVYFRKTTGFGLYEPNTLLSQDHDYVFITIPKTQKVVFAEINGGKAGKYAVMAAQFRASLSQNPTAKVLYGFPLKLPSKKKLIGMN